MTRTACNWHPLRRLLIFRGFEVHSAATRFLEITFLPSLISPLRYNGQHWPESNPRDALLVCIQVVQEHLCRMPGVREAYLAHDILL